MNVTPRAVGHSAWNPGLESELPRDLLPLSTMFRPENVSTGIAKAHELSDYCGLPLYDLVAFRVERLIVHELLIRVTAGVSVPDGTKYVDLGTNFRQIAANILEHYLAPHQAQLTQAFNDALGAASALIVQELASALPHGAPTKPLNATGGKNRWFNFNTLPAQARPPEEAAEARDRRILSRWLERSETADDRLAKSCFAALARIASAITGSAGAFSPTRPSSPKSP